jgi:hypothetical protein
MMPTGVGLTGVRPSKRGRIYYGRETADGKIECVRCGHAFRKGTGARHFRSTECSVWTEIRQYRDEGFAAIDGINEDTDAQKFLPKSAFCECRRGPTYHSVGGGGWSRTKTTYGWIVPKASAQLIGAIITIAKQSNPRVHYDKVLPSKFDVLKVWLARLFESEETVRTALVMIEHVREEAVYQQLMAFFDLPAFPSPKVKASPRGKNAAGPLFAAAGAP